MERAESLTHRRCLEMLEYELKRMVNKDIEYCKNEWEDYSFDWERMRDLFDKMIYKYSEIIDDFDKSMNVISPYEKENKCGDTYRDNVSLIIKRLERFRDNDFKNDGLNDESNPEHNILYYDKSKFDEVRLFFERSMQLSDAQKMEAVQKLDEMEEICASNIQPTEKWDTLRPYVMWLTGKNLIIVSHILPLIMLIKK